MSSREASGSEGLYTVDRRRALKLGVALLWVTPLVQQQVVAATPEPEDLEQNEGMPGQGFLPTTGGNTTALGGVGLGVIALGAAAMAWNRRVHTTESG